MRILSLKVRGAIGIKKGMGLDEINLDLSGVSGLVALAGQNGRGKTTILECATPFRKLASRDGALRHHFFLRESFRDLTFEYGGDVYRTLVKIDSDSDRSEGFIWKNDEPQVNGKVTAYDQYIKGLIGTDTLFYNSVFAAQNSKKLSDLPPGQLKSLFAEFLRLDRLARYEAAAKQCVNVLRGAAQQQERAIESLEARKQAFAGLDNEIDAAKVQKNALSDNLTAAENQIAESAKEITRLTDVSAKNAVNIERRTDIEEDIKAVREQSTASNDSFQTDIRQIMEAIRAKAAARDTAQEALRDKDAITTASVDLAKLEGNLSGLQQMDHDRAEALETIYEQGQAKGEDIQKLESDIEAALTSQELKGIGDAAEKTNRRMKDILDEIQGLEKELESARTPAGLIEIDARLKACQDTIAILDQRGDCPLDNPKCAFVLSALEAKEHLPELMRTKDGIKDSIAKKLFRIESKTADLQVEYDKSYLHLEDMAWQINAIKTDAAQTVAGLRMKVEAIKSEQETLRESARAIKAQRQETQAAIKQIKADIEEARAMAARLPEIQKAESDLESFNAQIADLEARHQALKDQHTRDDLQARAKIRDLERRLEEVNKAIDEQADQKLEEAREALAKAERVKADAAQGLKAIDERLAVLEQRREEKASIEKDLAAATAELGRVTAESSQWLYLQNACGKSGLQALEIDGVAPLITGYANDLLTSTFGPNFSVRLVTQDPETGKEILDIMVIREDGSEVSLSKLSGGEKVWVLKSLRLAMTLVSKQKSGRNFQTILCDEEDGPLDSEKAMSFVGLYKAILEVGGFDSCFYISHNPNVVGMADHRLDFTESGIVVN